MVGIVRLYLTYRVTFVTVSPSFHDMVSSCKTSCANQRVRITERATERVRLCGRLEITIKYNITFLITKAAVNIPLGLLPV